jgi:hypothetical protein
MQDGAAARGDGGMASIGARIRTPATCLVLPLEFPAKCDTSVEVPPMSNPITRLNPAAWAVRAMPTMPPAGPDRIESLPRNECAPARPPWDCMNCTRTPGSSPVTRPE